MKERQKILRLKKVHFTSPEHNEGCLVPSSGLSLRPGSNTTSSMQCLSVSGPIVSTEVGVEQLLSLGTAPGLDTQW